jgi:hypothetical protein
MRIEFECENELVECTIGFKSTYELDYMGITSNLLLNDLLKIEIEDFRSDSVVQAAIVSDLSVRKFNIKVLESKYTFLSVF